MYTGWRSTTDRFLRPRCDVTINCCDIISYCYWSRCCCRGCCSGWCRCGGGCGGGFSEFRHVLTVFHHLGCHHYQPSEYLFPNWFNEWSRQQEAIFTAVPELDRIWILDLCHTFSPIRWATRIRVWNTTQVMVNFNINILHLSHFQK